MCKVGLDSCDVWNDNNNNNNNLKASSHKGVIRLPPHPPTPTPTPTPMGKHLKPKDSSLIGYNSLIHLHKNLIRTILDHSTDVSTNIRDDKLIFSICAEFDMLNFLDSVAKLLKANIFKSLCSSGYENCQNVQNELNKLYHCWVHPQKYATPIIMQSILHLITKAIARRRIPIATNIEPLVSRSYYYNQKLNLGAYSMFEIEFDF